MADRQQNTLLKRKAVNSVTFAAALSKIPMKSTYHQKSAGIFDERFECTHVYVLVLNTCGSNGDKNVGPEIVYCSSVP